MSDGNNDTGADAIDWTPFDGLPEATCYCRCGGVFRSHAKGCVRDADETAERRVYRIVMTAKKQCPECGQSDKIYRVSHDPESYTISRSDNE